MEKKFKVWDKELKRYVEYTSHISIDVNGNVYNLQNGEGKDRYELIQYIGLKDKDKKEIYENYIIKGKLEIDNDNYDFEGVVTFEDGRFICENADFDLYMYESLEIVGNIYKNE
jgi:uncharacterized phage protein (TIGR01671 family)